MSAKASGTWGKGETLTTPEPRGKSIPSPQRRRHNLILRWHVGRRGFASKAHRNCPRKVKKKKIHHTIHMNASGFSPLWVSNPWPAAVSYMLLPAAVHIRYLGCSWANETYAIYDLWRVFSDFEVEVGGAKGGLIAIASLVRHG